VELLGLDVFDPVTMEVSHSAEDNVPAWFLDSNYNGMCFRVSQAFFPRTNEWGKLKTNLFVPHKDNLKPPLSFSCGGRVKMGES
jgi:adenine-specific DNA-methyltransferase